MFHRPLILLLVSYAGGILLAQAFPTFLTPFKYPLFLLFASSSLAIFFCSYRIKIYFLLFACFSGALLLTARENGPSKLESLARDYRKITIEGIVLKPAKTPREGMARIEIMATGTFDNSVLSSLDERLNLTIYRNAPGLEAGDKIRFTARLRPFENFNNPGNFDYKRSMKLQGIACAASISDGNQITLLGKGPLPFPENLIEKMQKPVRNLFTTRLNDRNASLYRALILGERQGIEPGIREIFNRTGLGHMLAVSGLHIGLVGWMSFCLFTWVLSRSYRMALTFSIRKATAVLTCFPIVGYTFLAGLQVSGQRAMIMALAFLGSLVSDRERDLWSTLALAGFLILLLDPNALLSISFQLSFAAVAGILWWLPPLLRKFGWQSSENGNSPNILKRFSGYFGGILAVSLAATLFLLPVTSYYFHRISLISLPANLTTVPILGFWVIPFGLLSAMLLPFSQQAATFIVQTGAWGLDLMLGIIRFWADLPIASIWTFTPNFFEILLFYSLLFCLYFFHRLPWSKTALALVIALILGDVLYWTYKVEFHRTLDVTFLDVGQGNAALICFPGGKKMLIDGGGFGSGDFDVGKAVVAPFLWHNKIGKVDYLVLSHPEADHMNGLRFIAEEFQPEEFWHNEDQVETPTFSELMSIIKGEKIKEKLPSDLKEGIKINGAIVEILHPMSGAAADTAGGNGSRLNNHSLVLRITFAGKSFLFPGDLEKEGENEMLAGTDGEIRSHVLLAPHHGSKTSSSKAFLEKVKPELCIVSAGKGASRNLPHPTVQKRLREMGCRVLTTSKAGAVTIRVGEKVFEVETFLNGKLDIKN